MTLLVDAGALVIQADAAAPNHRAVVRVLQDAIEPLVTTEIVLAEADYLILQQLGIDAELRFLDDLAAGTFVVECLTQEEIGLARDLARRYRDLRLGLADCSLVVLARRHNTRRIVTLNERDFRAITPLQGGAFRLLPADA